MVIHDVSTYNTVHVQLDYQNMSSQWIPQCLMPEIKMRDGVLSALFSRRLLRMPDASLDRMILKICTGLLTTDACL